MSREVPFQPMGPPRKALSHEHMQAVLAKHTKVNGGSGEPIASVRLPDGQSGHSPAQPKPSPTPATILQWDAPMKAFGGVHVLMSLCKRYSIHATKIKEGWQYQAMRRTAEWNNVLGWTRSKAEAVQLCESHAKRAA